MLLPCPHCGYQVALILPSPATAAPAPPARCPRCDAALPLEPAAAIRALEAPADDGPDSAAGAGEPTASATDAGAVAESGTVAPAPDPGPSASIAPATTDATTAAHGARRREPVPSFVRGRAAARSQRRRWPWVAASVALGLLLAVQLLLAQRHELAADARWRPWVAALCNALPCAIPTWHEPGAFTMLGRSVQPSRTRPGVLEIEASFRNDARWPQSWPTLLLSLADVEGHEVGRRAFAPSEYRAGGAGANDRLAPGQSATVRLQVREPAPGVVAFTFDFQ